MREAFLPTTLRHCSRVRATFVRLPCNGSGRRLLSDRLTVRWLRAEGYGRPPDLEEVHACIKALRSHAVPGGDQMEATFLKAAACRWPSGCSRSYALHGSRALHPQSKNLL